METLTRLALSIGAAALFAGCGETQPPIGASGAMLQSRAVAQRAAHDKYTELYSFKGRPADGADPAAALLNSMEKSTAPPTTAEDIDALKKVAAPFFR